MLSTFIREKYKLKDIPELAEAVNDLFDSDVDYGWASSGVYCFWDPNSYEILYIGLAVDLAQRFRQHNGLVSAQPNTCKFPEISKWFKSNAQIGYSVLVQSSLSQPSCKKFNMRFGLSREEMVEQYGELVKEGHEAIVNTEGLLIEAHKKATGKIPCWNKVGGSVFGGGKATSGHIYLLKLFSGELDDWMVARKSILHLSRNATHEKWENDLHAIRSHAIITQSTFKQAWNFFPLFGNTKEEIISSGYLPSTWIS